MTAGSCHVLVDGRSFVDASSFRGMGAYAREVVGGLAQQPGLTVSALVPRGAVLPAGVRPVHVVRLAPGRFQAREQELMLPRDLQRTQSDVVFMPANEPPTRCRRPWVQTLHDLIPLTGADPREEKRFRRLAVHYKAAAQMITGSRWAADEILRHLDVDAARLHVIPHGVAAHFRPGEGVVTDPPYALFVGEYDPRKRHATAYAAMGAVADQGLPHRLKVVGRIAPWFAEQMESLRNSAAYPDRIELLGHVSLDELVRLYQGASVLLLTSEAEGFGLPASESMACGTPVVGFANSATTDVVGAGGVLVEDGELGRLVAALAGVLGNEAYRHELSVAALQQASQFSWERSAAHHADVLRLAAG